MKVKNDHHCVALVLKGYRKSQEGLKTALSSYPQQRGFLANGNTFLRLPQASQTHEASYYEESDRGLKITAKKSD